MSSRIFFLNIMARVGLLIATIFLFVWLAESLVFEFLFTILAGSFLIIIQVLLLTRYVLGITRVIEQFIDAIGKEETPEIQFYTGKAVFQKLKERSNSIKEALNAGRLEKQKDERILKHVINLADPGLFCFNSNEEIVFVNDSARKLVFNNAIYNLEDVKDHNEKLWMALKAMKAGTPKVVRLVYETDRTDNSGNEQLTSIRLQELRIFEEQYKLYTLQNIQEELHKNESDSWQKIIRVLTHEIMNAVSPMLSLSKSMQRKVKPGKGKESEKILEGLKTIESTGKGLIDFVEEYRRLSLLPLPKKKELLLKDILEGVVLLFENEARESNIEIILETANPETVLYADPQQIEMILLNLLRNAFDSFKEAQAEKQVVIRTQGSGKRLQVKVEDNGEGISEELLDQVFVPFFSTKDHGSGIGLSLARQVMNNHEGSIYLESMVGKGTIVTLVF